MTALHPSLAGGGWAKLTLPQQLGNVGSEISRALKWKLKDANLFDQSMRRALELMDFTIRDPRWRHRLKELTRAREVMCDAWLGGREYGTDFESLNRYFFNFALAAKK